MMWILIVVMLALTIFHFWSKRGKAVKAFRMAMAESSCDSGDNAIIGHSILLCNRAIVSGIDCILSASAVEACRNNRIFGTLYAGYDAFRKKSGDGRDYECLGYLWEAGLKISELVRMIAITQEISLTLAEKDIIREIKDEILKISAMIQDGLTEMDDLKTNADRVKESLSARIRIYSGLMTYNDYRDGSAKYTYLLLLQALYTYLLSMMKVA